MGTLDGRKMLVVEDEMIVMMNLEFVLEDLGCSAIYPAASVVQALALLDQESFDIAILDVNLGEENSYPIADILIARGIPFAFSTGYSNHGTRTDLDSQLVLRKPYLSSDVARVVDQLLKH
ncbi:response regulator [Sphingorhabdus sp.]|uniref:response regulator n=1 Tax=Sphingorhabdus sp. TaxID=1902408 RepID=UPI0035932371